LKLYQERLALLESLTLISEDDTIHEDLEPPKTNPKTESILKNGLAIASLAVPIPGLTLAIFYLADVNRYKCAAKVEREGGENKSVRFAQCRLAAAKWAENYVKKEIAKCKSTKDPGKCQKKLFKLLRSVVQKRVDAEGKLRWVVAKTKERQRRAGL